MTRIEIRGITLNTKIIGKGYPLAIMHGGPGADLYTMTPLKPLSDQFTLVFYDHRCNGRSMGPDISTFNWENLTADADALQSTLGFEKWAVLGHSFGGMVALEYALRYPQRLSHLILMDSGADYRWPQENASKVLAQRGFSPETIAEAHAYFNGQIRPNQMFSIFMKLGKAYNPHMNAWDMRHIMLDGIQSRMRPEALIYAETHFLKGWSVMDRLGEINAPTLIVAGKDDFIFPPEHQKELAAKIPNSKLVLIDRAGHNPHIEQPSATLEAIRQFLAG